MKANKIKRIVITGGPGTGKTTLINFLEKVGHKCIPEISREVILEAQKKGIDQLFLEDPILFSKLLLEGRLRQYLETSDATEIVFYDRGLPDVTAYMDYLDTTYDDSFTEVCLNNKYDSIFLLPPWKDIYAQDNERYETFTQAQTIYKHLKSGYEKYGYEVVEVPIGPLENRRQFILEHIQNSN